jgi:hypothetical protein
MTRQVLGLCVGFALAANTAAAQPTSPPPGPTDPVPVEPPPPPAPEDEAAVEEEEVEEEIDLEAKAQELETKVEELEAKLNAAEQSRRAKFPVKLTGYGDIGLFATEGDGAGFRRDIGYEAFPEHTGFGWVFYGDLLATQINSRGDVADLGDVPGVDRFDSVDSQGNLTFLVNELNLSVNAGLGSRALFTSSVNFTPRTGTEFRLGDSFDVDIVQVEWMPTADGKTSVFVGKVDSVIGHEYKSRKAPQRFGITPSLLARYTTGTAVGLKARTLLFDDYIILAAAVTNGSFGTEQFHFFSETDTNNFKTLSGKASLRLPFGTDSSFEVGPSGSWGTQDGTPNGGGKMSFWGVDAELELMSRIAVKAQFLRGKAPGDDVNMTYSLDLKNGGYVESNIVLTPIIGVYGRAEFRDAIVEQGTERIYVTKNWKGTGGVRLIFNPNAILKAEYSHNGEYGGVPSIPDDVVTTSAVMAF